MAPGRAPVLGTRAGPGAPLRRVPRASRSPFGIPRASPRPPPRPPCALSGSSLPSSFSPGGPLALPAPSWGSSVPSRGSPTPPRFLLRVPFPSPRVPQLSLLLFGVCLFPPRVLKRLPISSRESFGPPHAFLGFLCGPLGLKTLLSPSWVSTAARFPPGVLLHPPTLPVSPAHRWPENWRTRRTGMHPP